MGIPAWRRALIRKLKSGDHDSFGGNNPDTDMASALIWLRTGMSNTCSPDFKIVVRPNRRTMKFTYRFCVGNLGFSASDHNSIAVVVEGTDF